MLRYQGVRREEFWFHASKQELNSEFNGRTDKEKQVVSLIKSSKREGEKVFFISFLVWFLLVLPPAGRCLSRLTLGF